MSDAQIILKNLSVLVGEWIPFGANQIVAINEKLGASDRCQVGFYWRVGLDPTATSFEVPAGLTAVGMATAVKYVNIEAKINFPEDEGIVQVEEFGMHFAVNGGRVRHAHRCDHGQASGRHLHRSACALLVDVHLDSSRITRI